MRHRAIIAFFAIVLLIGLSGCSYSRNMRRSSSLMDYLYPNATEAPQPSAQARLQLPLRVGIAFVPMRGTGSGWNNALPAETENKLLRIVQKTFEGRDWVKEVAIIPSSYLTAGGGFENLEQLARLFNADVIALASVDQVQNSDPTPVSFLYLSIIGAYTLPLDRNETRTLIDAAVFDIPSRTFILRAPGQSQVKGFSTAVGVNEALRDASYRGFEEAMEDLAKNLTGEVDRFKERVVSGERTDVEVINKSGQSIRQSGDFGLLEALASLVLGAAAWRRGRKSSR